MSRGDIITFFENRVFSTAETVTGDWIGPSTSKLLASAKQLYFVLEITAAATDAGDILAVKVQEGLPGATGLVANDRLRFPDITGNGGTGTFWFEIDTFTQPSAATALASVAAAASAHQQGPIAQNLRFVVTLTDADADASFTATLRCVVKT